VLRVDLSPVDLGDEILEKGREVGGLGEGLLVLGLELR